MRKIMALVLAGLLVGSFMSTGAVAGKKKKVTQTVEGHILFPAGHPANAEGCFAGLHRRLLILSQGSEGIQGLVGYNWDVDPKTWGKKFKLETSGGVGTVDFDLYYYAEYGTADPNGADPVNFSPGASAEFTTREAGGEAGVVPTGMNHAITCIYANNAASGPQAGGNADFVYTAGDKVK
ncbi:MAG: hypothetical protein M3345_08250 [Actinomycetota bacterium]|nr:hypothetical protein [Actinomycetota bacterium]